ncbi:MAG TPA: glycosyltransferase family 4 protein [Candidatus Polarisedimenticolaceae bacterium]|nr:glycosyltransferase family 4 protein [Candidatus Polarisedimenticolaceae bacterium]
MTTQRQLLFVSTRFLFPADSGGKIRTTQILRGLKGGQFAITLASPGPAADGRSWDAELERACDRFAGWPARREHRWFPVTRMLHLVERLPIPVATDRSAAGRRVVAAELAQRPAVAVFDFPHAAVLAPGGIGVPSVLFTHNVESWIFRRHAEVERNPLKRAIWADQERKMRRFEAETLRSFDTIVAVSEGDAEWFRDELGIRDVAVIPTGVDLDYFHWGPPGDSSRVLFTGSMDWLANQDGIEYLLEEIWPHVVRALPAARMRVVGRKPPPALVSRAAAHGWEFTGFVDDVRPHVATGSVYVIPLRVGGGTRIKAYEAIAMGLPVVSTSIGVEGLPLVPDEHYLCADTPEEFAAAVVRLLCDPDQRLTLSRAARRYVEERFSIERAARVFEEICERTASRGARA